MTFLIILVIILIASIIYEHKKLNRIKKEFRKANLFEDLVNFGFILSDSSAKNKDTKKWFSKKDEKDEFEYHCSFYIDRGKVDFEIILEMKRRVVNNNDGLIHDFKLSRRYKEKKLHLANNSFIKNYTVKTVTDLPDIKEIMSDFTDMIKILKKENIRTLNKFEQ